MLRANIRDHRRSAILSVQWVICEPTEPRGVNEGAIVSQAGVQFLRIKRFQTNLFVLLVSVSTAFASTAANVKADLVSITTATNKLDAQIVAYPATGGTLAGALAIHTNSTALITLVDTGKTDALNITPKPSSVADATDIIALVTTLKPSIQSALVHIVQKKPAFAALPLGNVVALVKGDLVALNASTYTFSTALVDSTPSSLVSQATALKNDIAGYFATALAAYA